jgi:hypothetical protein
LVVFNWILFFISSLIIWFLKFIFKFDAHSLNYYLFCFELFYWLICFFLQFHPRHFFHLIFVLNLVMFFLVVIFKSFSWWIDVLKFYLWIFNFIWFLCWI